MTEDIASRDEIELLAPPPSDGLPRYLRSQTEEMLLDPALWSMIPYRVLLIIIEYIEIVVHKDVEYHIPTRFYGYFRLDRWRKLFLVFTSISVRGDLTVDVPAPLQHVRCLRLRLHPDQVPHPAAVFPRLRSLKCLRTFSLPNENPQNLEFLPDSVSRGLKTLEVAAHRPGFLSDSDRLLRILNERFPNLKNLSLTTWKSEFLGEDPYAPEVPLALPRLRKLSLFDFPVIASPVWFHDVFAISRSIVSFQCVNCVIDVACLRNVGESAHSLSSLRRVVLRRCVIEGGLKDLFARSHSIRELVLHQSRVEEDLVDGLTFNSESRLASLDVSEVNLAEDFWALAGVGLVKLRSLIAERSGIDEESIRALVENARWDWHSFLITVPKSTSEPVVKLLVDAGAVVALK